MTLQCTKGDKYMECEGRKEQGLLTQLGLGVVRGNFPVENEA